MWFMEEPSQFSVGQTAKSLICSIMETPHTGTDDCLNMVLACLRKRMSAKVRVTRPSNASSTASEVTRVEETTDEDEEEDDEEQLVSTAFFTSGEVTQVNGS